jgi:hypothetical protein
MLAYEYRVVMNAMYLPRKLRRALLFVDSHGWNVRNWIRQLTPADADRLGVNRDQLRYAFDNHLFIAAWQRDIEDHDGEADYRAEYGID